MHFHGTTCLKGPVTQDRPWWAGPPRQPRKRARTTEQPIRTDLVTRVRLAIAAGNYDTPERWDAALDRLAAILQRP
jgi:hypothetical protein